MVKAVLRKIQKDQIPSSVLHYPNIRILTVRIQAQQTKPSSDKPCFLNRKCRYYTEDWRSKGRGMLIGTTLLE